MENFLEHNIDIHEYITGNRFIDICETLQITFCKTDYLSDYTNTEQSIFVTHNSDYHIERNRYSIKPRKIKKWFALNKDYDDNNIISIPIGVESMNFRINPTSHMGKYSSRGNGKDSFGKAIYLDKLAKQKIKHDKLIYLNMNPDTFRLERQHVLDLFGEDPRVTNRKNLIWKEYYEDLASHKFVISPRGNGVDCHRTWEALYLRTIPIVRRSVCMNEFEDLPILYIDKWEELCYTNLQEKYEEMVSKKYDLGKMKISYWEKRIADAAGRVNECQPLPGARL